MPERLTDSLVRLGKLDASRANEALHRQVMSGGALDTALLELDLVSESDLRAALADAYGIDCADAARALAPEDPRAARAFPEAWAKKHMLAPLRISGSGERLELLSPAPVDGALLGRLSDLLELQLVPVAAPEFRVWQRLARLYDVEPPERFRDLIRDRADDATDAPLEVPPPASDPPAPDAPEGPLGFSEAVSHLRDARDRDDIVRTALRYAMRDLELVAMFINHDDHLEGWLGRGPGAERVPHLSVELTPDSAFRVVLDTQAHYLGPLPADEAHQAFLEAMGRPRPHSVIVVPVRIRSRTVALLYGENGTATISPRLAADLMLFTTHLQMSLEALLLRRKAETLSELRGAPAAPPAAEEVTEESPGIEPEALTPSADTDADEIPIMDPEPDAEATAQAAPPRRTSAASLALEEMLDAAAEDLDADEPVDPPPPDDPGATEDEPFPLLDAVEAPFGSVDLPEESIDLPLETIEDLPEDEPITLSDTPREALGRAASWVQGLPPDDSIPPPADDVEDDGADHPLIDEDGWSDVDASSLGSEWEPSVDEVKATLQSDELESDGLNRAAIAESDDGDALLQELDELSSSLEEALAVSERASPADPLDLLDAEDDAEDEPEEEAGAIDVIDAIDATALGQSAGLVEAPDEGWDEVDVDEAWTASPQTYVGASPAASQDPTLPSGPRAPLSAPSAPNGAHEPRETEDETLPDLSAEAWIRASSEITRARPLPAEVMEAAARPAEPDPVPLTRITIGRRESGALPSELQEVHPYATKDDRFEDPALFPTVAEDDFPLPLELPDEPDDDDDDDDEPVPLTEMTGRTEDSHPGFAEEPVPLTHRTGSVRAMPAATKPVDHAAVEDAHTRAALLEALDGSDPSQRAAAADALAGLGPEVLPELAERFPGRTQLDPFTTDAELPPFAKCGALLSVLERLGRDAHPYVAPFLDAQSPHHRFFAIYFYAAVFAPEAIPRLTQRLHDEEPRNCMLAARTLFSYREHPDFEGVMHHLHGRLTAASVNARRHACYLLGLFRDVTAIPLLVDVLDKKDKAMTEVVEDALAEITKQRFGPSPKKWRAWWTKNKDRSRLAWLVDGLSAKEEELRRSAAEELRAVTGLDMGFDEAAPKRQREEARLRWVQWWRDQ